MFDANSSFIIHYTNHPTPKHQPLNQTAWKDSLPLELDWHRPHEKLPPTIHQTKQGTDNQWAPDSKLTLAS